jgi:hypothetical protein
VAFNFPGIYQPQGEPTLEGLQRWAIHAYAIVNNILRGKLNCTGEITLTASSATTTLTDARITAASYIDFMPTTANAANAKTTLYVSARTTGEATLTHASDPTTDRTFVYSITG